MTRTSVRPSPAKKARTRPSGGAKVTAPPKTQAARPGTSRKAAPDFFISRNRADQQWAEWIAWQLEEAGYRTVIQDWDFGAGANFVLEMQRATAEAKRTIAVLSLDFLASAFTAPEWAAAFAADPTGANRKLIPIRVRTCKPTGLLAQIVYTDLVGLSESEAKALLLRKVKPGRAKPTTAPAFPGKSHGKKPNFPGKQRAARTSKPSPSVRSARPADRILDVVAVEAHLDRHHWGTDPPQRGGWSGDTWFGAIIVPERQNSPYLSELQLGQPELQDRLLQLALHGKSAVLRPTLSTTPHERADHLLFEQSDLRGRGSAASLAVHTDGTLVFRTTIERATSSSGRSLAGSHIIDEQAARSGLIAFIAFADGFFRQRRRDPGSLYLGMSLAGIGYKHFGRLPTHEVNTFTFAGHQLADPLHLPSAPLKISAAQRARPASVATTAIAHIARAFRLAGAYYPP